MPVGHPYDGGQSPLEAAAIAARNVLIAINTFNSVSPGNEYTSTNTYAISDASTPIYGKGSGNFLDINNYAGVGGSWDMNGNPTNPNSAGSGRNPAFALNGSLWGYGPAGLGMTNYVAPNTSLNVGQVII
jgi:hypothetical protein